VLHACMCMCVMYACMCWCVVGGRIWLLGVCLANLLRRMRLLHLLVRHGPLHSNGTFLSWTSPPLASTCLHLPPLDST
jgi:hypothetical protein